MKHHLTLAWMLGAALATLAPSVSAQAQTPAANPALSQADEDWKTFASAINDPEGRPEQFYIKLHPRPKEGGAVEGFQWSFEWLKNLRKVGLAFMEKHPTDPRRWTAVLRMHNYYKSWAGQLGSGGGLSEQPPEVQAAVEAIWPAVERKAYEQQLAQLETAALAAPDIGVSERFYFSSYQLRGKIRMAAKNQLPPDAPEWKTYAAELLKLSAAHPAADGGYLVAQYQSDRFPIGTDPTAGKPVIDALAASPNKSMAEEARKQLKNIELVSKPIAFTAVDGREVDLGKLKGKVVLVDFWATWCGPCIAELPNVKKVYAAYHDKGFEVVGIALENGKLLPGDTPEQTTAKLAAAKKILTDFTAKNEMPWPQYFDGKFWKTEFAARYAIQGIPAMFLIGPDGKVVSTNARGEKLEAEVKRLLKF